MILVLFVMEVSVGVVEGTVEEGGGVLLVEGVEGGDGIVAEGVGIVEDAADADPLSDDDRGRGRRVTPKAEIAERMEAAIAAYKADMYKSVRQCALAFRVCHSKLNSMLKDPDSKYVGKGRVSKVFNTMEEERIAKHIKERMMVGCGMDILQV